MSRTPIEAIAEELDVPDSAYETARERYEDLGKWLSEPNKTESAQYAPQVSSQGSFQLGTAIKPLRGGEYDLDITCVLRQGITKTSISQKDLKRMLGNDLRKYRQERQIQEQLIEKQRCWRLNYQDDLAFHLDILPALPQSEEKRQTLSARMATAGISDSTATSIAENAIAITDNHHPAYRDITQQWPISNPKGYALWFQSRMQLASELLTQKALVENVATIDDLPAYRWRSPLQQAVQVLKRHRDVMFHNDPDGKPISIIITTLAARAYTGESTLQATLTTILRAMRNLINPSAPRIPNPINPLEDFADKWHTPQGREANLERNFYLWLEQASSDLTGLAEPSNANQAIEHAALKFAVTLSRESFSIAQSNASTSTARMTTITDAPRPWQR